MTVYTLTLTSLRSDKSDANPQTLRAVFNNEWKRIEPIVRAVPGVEVLRVGRFGTTVKVDDDARDKLKAALPRRWELVPPPPAPTLLARGPKCPEQ